MTITVDPWEFERADLAAQLTKQALTEGTDGAETLGPLTTTYDPAADPAVRRSAYALFRALSIVSPWVPLTFFAGWSNYPPGYSQAAFMIDPFGRVHLRGLVQRTSGVLLTIATLPTPVRPAFQKVFRIATDNGAGGDADGRLDITAAGVLTLAGPGVAYVSLEGVSYDTRG